MSARNVFRVCVPSREQQAAKYIQHDYMPHIFYFAREDWVEGLHNRFKAAVQGDGVNR